MSRDAVNDPRSPTSAIAVSVLIPVFNEGAHIAATIQAMQAQLPPGGEIEFLFVDGRSTDATRSILETASQADPRIRIFDNPKRITSAGLNIALSEARGRYAARMDAHCHYPTNYLRTGVTRLERGDVASVSGPQLAIGDDVWSGRVAYALQSRLGIGGAEFRRPITQEIEVDSGFTGLWSTDLLRQYGGWDEPAYPNEDAELAARLRADGGRIVCVPAMAARYIPRNSLKALTKQYWRYGRARARTGALHANGLRLPHLVPPALVVTLALSLLPRLRVARAARLAIGAYLAGLAHATVTGLRRGATEARYLPVVLPTMHLSWGAGFLEGVRRFGPPRRLRPRRRR